MSNRFLIAFGTEGWEAVVNLTEIEEAGVLEKLSSTDGTASVWQSRVANVDILRFGFKANHQRHIETYIMNVDKNLSEDDVKKWFETAPNSAIDLIRERGMFVKAFSNKANFLWRVK